MALMLQHDDALRGFDVCFLFHCFVSFWGRCAQNYQKIYFKNYKNSRRGEAFDNFMIQFSYNFERSDHELLLYYDLSASVDIEALGRRLPVEAATVEGVPRIRTINHEP